MVGTWLADKSCTLEEGFHVLGPTRSIEGSTNACMSELDIGVTYGGDEVEATKHNCRNKKRTRLMVNYVGERGNGAFFGCVLDHLVLHSRFGFLEEARDGGIEAMEQRRCWQGFKRNHVHSH